MTSERDVSANFNQRTAGTRELGQDSVSEERLGARPEIEADVGLEVHDVLRGVDRPGVRTRRSLGIFSGFDSRANLFEVAVVPETLECIQDRGIARTP
jgi:hypothetical protein